MSRTNATAAPAEPTTHRQKVGRASLITTRDLERDASTGSNLSDDFLAVCSLLIAGVANAMISVTPTSSAHPTNS